MRLVVTADDLGLSPAVTRGVLEAHRRGVVRATSLLVTYPGAEEAAALARAEHGLEVGLHLDLVGGSPAADPASVRSLIDADGRFHRLRDAPPVPPADPASVRSLIAADGRFHRLGELPRLLALGRVRAGELAREIRAQAALARAWGVEARAWDSHRHTHLLPPVARVVGAVAREEGVRWLRRAAPPAVPRAARPAALAVATALAAPFLRGVPGNDWYVDLSSWWPPLDAGAVALLAARPGVGELGAHPGYLDDALAARDPLLARRVDELRVLTDPLLVAAISRLVGRRIVP